jgi:hypothetical protein
MCRCLHRRLGGTVREFQGILLSFARLRCGRLLPDNSHDERIKAYRNDQACNDEIGERGTLGALDDDEIEQAPQKYERDKGGHNSLLLVLVLTQYCTGGKPDYQQTAHNRNTKPRKLHSRSRHIVRLCTAMPEL